MPGILLIINTWKKLSLKKNLKTICNVLIECFVEKFHFKLYSNAYLIASLLNVTKLRLWYWENLSTDFLKRAPKVLMEIMGYYCHKETEEPKIGNVSQEIKRSKNKFVNDDDSLFALAVEEALKNHNQIKNFRSSTDLQKEIDSFFLMINEQSKLESVLLNGRFK